MMPSVCLVCLQLVGAGAHKTLDGWVCAACWERCGEEVLSSELDVYERVVPKGMENLLQCVRDDEGLRCVPLGWDDGSRN